MTYRNYFLMSIVWILMIALGGVCVQAEEQGSYKSAVEEDWRQQEETLARTLDSREALEALVARSREFCEWYAEQEWAEESQIIAMERQCSEAHDALGVEENSEEYQRNYIALRSLIRDVALSHPSIQGQPLVFMKHNRFTWQMLHEFMSYYYQATESHGGGVYILKEPGKSFETESLTDEFPRGVFSTLSLSYDAKTIYFAFADFSKVPKKENPPKNAADLMGEGYVDNFETEYMRQEEGKFHLFKMNLEDGHFEQLTTGPNDDFDPVELPSGELVFVSTRRGGFGRCHGGWEPLRVHTLHRLNEDRSVTCLSWHETNEWQPAVLNDGRIVYTRWDYVDRSASHHHGLWTTNPDGTNAAVLFANYTFKINACYQAKAIPNSKKILFVGGSHHLDIGGPLAMLDPTKIHYDPETAEDDLTAMELLTPEIIMPEVYGASEQVCNQYYHSPWPLSEEVWLTAYSHEPLGGYLAGSYACGKLGLYYRDRFGNLELLYRDDQIESAMYPIPLVEREKPPVMPSALPDDPEDTGTFVLSNVYESLIPFPQDRKIKELRVIQLLPKGPGHQGNVPPVGNAFAANARMLLGTVPVEKDGSAYFKVPARVPVYFQAVDESGRAVQSMRSLVYLQPGENRGCIGCHEQALTVQANAMERSLASLREPSEIVPGPENTSPFSYPLFVQPILDRACLSCHNGDTGAAKPNLSGDAEDQFSISYNNLKSYIRWYEWGENSFRETVTLPGESGSDISPLTEILTDKNHKKMDLSDKDRRNLYLWLDMNAPFYGVLDEEEQSRQQNGESVAAPALQ